MSVKKKIKQIGFTTLLLFFYYVIIAQVPPGIQWQKSFGGLQNDQAMYGVTCTDGGYITVGTSRSTNGDVTGSHGEFDVWVVKTNSNGVMQWQKPLGGTNWDFGNFIQQTLDGGYIIAGRTGSNDGDASGNHGSFDAWVIKLNSAGNIEWQKCLGGSSTDVAYCVRQTSDGGYIVACNTGSNDGDVSGFHGLLDYWVVKLSNTGTIQWQKCFGGTDNEQIFCIRQTADGGYIASGESKSNDADVTGNHGDFDYWVIKITDAGILQWQKSLGGISSDGALGIATTNDGGYIVTGQASSFGGDVTGNHGTYDAWVVKLDANGNKVWQKCFGGPAVDVGTDIFQQANGTYIMTSYAASTSGDPTGNHGLVDFWLVNFDANGNLIWQKTYGGDKNDICFAVSPTTDNGFILFGYSASANGDLTSNQGGDDYWIVKLNAQVITSINDPNYLPGVSVFPTLTLDGKIYIARPDQQQYFFTVFGSDGKIIIGETKLQSIIEISGVSKGVYLIQIRQRNKRVNFRVVKG